jgi:hypothetical protein
MTGKTDEHHRLHRFCGIMPGMRRLTLAALLLVIGLTVLAPPGLCPCWLLADVREIHPHPFLRPELPHPHNYLFELFQADSPAVAPVIPSPAYVLLALLGLSALWRPVMHQPLTAKGWAAPPPVPPPRVSD